MAISRLGSPSMAQCSKDLEAMVLYSNLRRKGLRFSLSRKPSKRTGGIFRAFWGVEKGFCCWVRIYRIGWRFRGVGLHTSLASTNEDNRQRRTEGLKAQSQGFEIRE